MNEWPKGELSRNLSEQLDLVASIDRALRARYEELTATTNPEPRPFMGFGRSEEVIEYLKTHGIDVGELIVKTTNMGMSVAIYSKNQPKPIYANYFPDPSEKDLDDWNAEVGESN
jgi:hypothetical protein